MVRARDGRRRRRGGSHPYSRGVVRRRGGRARTLPQILHWRVPPSSRATAPFDARSSLALSLRALRSCDDRGWARGRVSDLGTGVGRARRWWCFSAMRRRTSADSLGAADASSSFFFGLFFFRRSGLGPFGVLEPAPFPEGFTMRSLGRSGVTFVPRGPRFGTFPDESLAKQLKLPRRGKLDDECATWKMRARGPQRPRAQDTREHHSMGCFNSTPVQQPRVRAPMRATQVHMVPTHGTYSRYFDQARAAFTEGDVNHDGVLDRNELFGVLMRLGFFNGVPPEMIQTIADSEMRKADSQQKDQHITFDGASTILLLDPSRQSTHLNRRRREPRLPMPSNPS